jgi:hypothetical protein
MDRDAMNERMIKWLRWITQSGSLRQDMIAGYQLIAIVALSGIVLAVLWGRL